MDLPLCRAQLSRTRGRVLRQESASATRRGRGRPRRATSTGSSARARSWARSRASTGHRLQPTWATARACATTPRACGCGFQRNEDQLAGSGATRERPDVDGWAGVQLAEELAWSSIWRWMRSTLRSSIPCLLRFPGLLEDFQAGGVDHPELLHHVEGLAGVVLLSCGLVLPPVS